MKPVLPLESLKAVNSNECSEELLLKLEKSKYWYFYKDDADVDQLWRQLPLLVACFIVLYRVFVSLYILYITTTLTISTPAYYSLHIIQDRQLV